MGYAHYELPDGREAGYGVAAECDKDGCHVQIDRGLGWLCGDNPLGHKDADESGCGNYFCSDHGHAHDCPAPQCGYNEDESEYCVLVTGHDAPHTNDQGEQYP